jgi:hypothetical protein
MRDQRPPELRLVDLQRGDQARVGGAFLLEEISEEARPDLVTAAERGPARCTAEAPPWTGRECSCAGVRSF